MALSKEEILDAIAEMSVIDIVDLIEAMEEKFGVSAAAPVAAAAPAAVSYKSNFDEIDTAGNGAVPMPNVLKYLKTRIDAADRDAMKRVAAKVPEIKAAIKSKAVTPKEFDLVMRLVALQQSKGSIPASITSATLLAMDLPRAKLKGDTAATHQSGAGNRQEDSKELPARQGRRGDPQQIPLSAFV